MTAKLPAREAIVYVLIGKLNWRDLYKFLMVSNAIYSTTFTNAFMEI